MSSKHNSIEFNKSIQVFILFHEEGFLSHSSPDQNIAISVHTSQYLAKVDAAKI